MGKRCLEFLKKSDAGNLVKNINLCREVWLGKASVRCWKKKSMIGCHIPNVDDETIWTGFWVTSWWLSKLFKSYLFKSACLAEGEGCLLYNLLSRICFLVILRVTVTLSLIWSEKKKTENPIKRLSEISVIQHEIDHTTESIGFRYLIWGPFSFRWERFYFISYVKYLSKQNIYENWVWTKESHIPFVSLIFL